MWGQLRDKWRSVIIEIRTYGRTIRCTMGRSAEEWRNICIPIASQMVLTDGVGEYATAGIVVGASFALLDLD